MPRVTYTSGVLLRSVCDEGCLACETALEAWLFRHGIDPDRVTDAQAREALAAVRGGS